MAAQFRIGFYSLCRGIRSRHIGKPTAHLLFIGDDRDSDFLLRQRGKPPAEVEAFDGVLVKNADTAFPLKD